MKIINFEKKYLSIFNSLNIYFDLITFLFLFWIIFWKFILIKLN